MIGTHVYLLPLAGGEIQRVAWPDYMKKSEDYLRRFLQFWDEDEAIVAAVKREGQRKRAALQVQAAAS